MREDGTKLLKFQARYKRNFDGRLRKQRDRILANYHFFIRFDKNRRYERRQTISPVSSVPYLVKSVKYRGFIYTDRTSPWKTCH